MSMQHTLQVPIRLAVDDKQRHWVYLTPRSEREKRQSLHHPTEYGGATVEHTAEILNGRDNPSLTLDEAGFELVPCPTQLSNQDFYDGAAASQKNPQLLEQYKQEIVDFLQKKLQCDKVVCFHSAIRNEARQGQDGIEGYAGGGPHTDSSSISGDEVALAMLPEAGDEKYKRYLYLNVWRNIADGAPIQDNHLALLDERTTVKPDDYIVRDLQGPGYSVVQYGLNARHASVHQWYYFPNMTKHEAILFKQIDSDWTKTARTCFHMSFKDETAPANLPPRESIELRCLCYWKEAAVDSMPTKENTNAHLVQDPFKKQNHGVGLQSATVWELVLALFARIPLIGALLLGRQYAPQSTYSGNPNDYLARFLSAVGGYANWPAFAKTWAEGQMRRANSVETGIATLTTLLVDDSAGFQGTKNFASAEKQAIVAMLLDNHEYMASAQKHWGALPCNGVAAAYYSGNPRDYLDEFVGTVEGLPYWPQDAKTWAKQQMNQASSVEKGIATITMLLVQDSARHHGTANFTASQHKEIADVLLANERFMASAKKHLGALK